MKAYAPLHPGPCLRLGRSLAATGWTLAARRQRPELLQVWARRVLAALDIEVALAAPVPGGGQLWVSNHLSWVDPLVYLALRPSRVMAKAEVAGYPFIGPGARRSGLRFVRRECLFSRAAALRTLVRDLRAGEACLVFPEGTTTLGEGLAPLQEGSLRMAYRLGVTVLPLRLACADPHYPWIGDDTLPPHLLALARSRRTRVELHPGRVLDPREGMDEQTWIDAIRAQLQPHDHGESLCIPKAC